MSKFKDHINSRQILLFLLYFFFFFLLLKNSFNYLDPDLGWHLKVGQQVAQEHKLPNINTFNFSFTGNWVDHEWLINYLVYSVWNSFGYIFLTIAFSLLIILILLLMFNRARRTCPESSLFLIAAIQIFGLFAALPHFGVRMQEIGLLFLILLLLIIERYNKNEKDWQTLLLLPPLFYFWALLHASFLIGFFILGMWALVKSFEILVAHFWPKPYFDLSEKISDRQLLYFSVASLLSLATSTLTPYGYKLYSFLNGYKDTYYQSHIQEWLSQLSFPYNYWQLSYLAFVGLAIFFYLYYSIGREKLFKINIWKLCLVSSFAILSFKSRRHFPLLFVCSFAFLVEIFCRLFSLPTKCKEQWTSRWVNACIVLCLLLVSVSFAVKTEYTTNPFQAYCSDYPCGAAEFLRSHDEYKNANLFNEYNWGGYLIWQLPERKLFIDGRLPQVAFAGHTFLEEYYDFYQAEKVVQKLEQYQIRLVLLQSKDIEIKVSTWEKIIFGIREADLRTTNDLRKYLASSPEWQLVYNDQTSVIYYKK